MNPTFYHLTSLTNKRSTGTMLSVCLYSQPVSTANSYAEAPKWAVSTGLKKNFNGFIWWSTGTRISFTCHLCFLSGHSFTQMVLPNNDIDWPIIGRD